MATLNSLPETHRALVLTSTKDPLDLSVQSQPTPQPTSGSAIVHILASPVLPYARAVYSGQLPYPFPTPFTPGSSAIARVAAVGPDATRTKPGQLVFITSFITGRDDPDASILSGLHSGFIPSSKVLMEQEWRNGSYAEYQKVPLENCFSLNEEMLLGPTGNNGMGYAIEHLCFMSTLLVPFGGLRDVGLKAGETVIIAPATGTFGGAAVLCALAMGAGKVIVMGRNSESLGKLVGVSQHGRVHAVRTTGDVQADTEALRIHGPVDVFLDMSPPGAAGSTHFKSALLALRRGGRVSIMGGIQGDISIPYPVVMSSNLSLRGRFMFTREDAEAFIRLVEAGILKLGLAGGQKVVGKFNLDEFEAAFDAAAGSSGMGLQTLIIP